MDFAISRNALYSSLEKVKQITSNARHTMAILDKALFTLTGDMLEIRASDSETHIITKVELIRAGAEGSITAPVSYLLGSLRELREMPLEFSIDTENYSIHITPQYAKKSGVYKLQGGDPNDFPELPEENPEATVVKTTTDLLVAGLTNTLNFVAKPNLQPALSGICLEFTPEYMRMVGTDSRRLALFTHSSNHTSENHRLLLRNNSAEFLQSYLNQNSQELTIQIDENNLQFLTENSRIIVRLTDITFPNYDMVFPKGDYTAMRVNTKLWEEAIRQVTPFSEKSKSRITLNVQNNELKLTTRSYDNSNTAFQIIDCEYNHPDIEVIAEIEHLTGCLTHIESEDTELQFYNDGKLMQIIPTEPLAEDIDLRFIFISPMA